MSSRNFFRAAFFAQPEDRKVIEIGGKAVFVAYGAVEPREKARIHFERALAMTTNEMMMMRMPMPFVLAAPLSQIRLRNQAETRKQIEIAIDDGFVEARIGAARAFQNFVRAEMRVRGGDDRKDDAARFGQPASGGFDLLLKLVVGSFHYCN